MSNNNFVTLTLQDGKSVQLPVLQGTAGPAMIDIRTLHSTTGMFTFDPGIVVNTTTEPPLYLSLHVPPSILDMWRMCGVCVVHVVWCGVRYMCSWVVVV